jgi:hypothetical protein
MIVWPRMKEAVKKPDSDSGRVICSNQNWLWRTKCEFLSCAYSRQPLLAFLDFLPLALAKI